MARQGFDAHRVWTVAEAKSRLSELLRLAEEEGPQHIGKRRSFVVVPAGEWYAARPPRRPMGQWLVENLPRGANLDVAGMRASARGIPFVDGDDG